MDGASLKPGGGRWERDDQRSGARIGRVEVTAEHDDGHPPRSGALAVLPLVGRLRPRRLVYISCHPGTLARDAGILVHQHRFQLLAAGVVDMFPHTAHVESMAVFDKA